MGVLDSNTFESTRRALHGVAELLIAGPQYRAHGTIRLGVTTGGFGGVVLDVRVDGTDIVQEDRRFPISGTPRQLADAVGVDVGRPEGLYADGSGVGADDQLLVERNAAEAIATWFATGVAALRVVLDSEQAVLWPEHFDLGLAVDEVNYGVSPGDAEEPRPYAYVSPWRRRSGAFWNASFGASRTFADLDDPEAVADFFRVGREAATG